MSHTNRTAAACYKELTRHLAAYGRYEEVLDLFSQMQSNRARVEFLQDLIEVYGLFPRFSLDRKDEDIAVELRKMGNEEFKIRSNKEALEFYTQSLCHAEDKSPNAALAYANRSAVLFEKKMYKECLTDIERALAYDNYPAHLKEKLIARGEKSKALLPTQFHRAHCQPLPEIPENSRHRTIACASDNVKIERTEDMGRRVVATRDIPIGEVIAIEKPFSALLINEMFIHCHECFKLCYNLIPCKNCTKALYCDDTCMQRAQHYHRYECKIAKTLQLLDLDKMRLLPLRITLSVKHLYQDIAKSNWSNDDKYLSDRYKEMHHLITHQEKRSPSDMFSRSATVAIIYDLVKNHTDFFDRETEGPVFMDLLMHLLQTAVCNFHEISEFADDAGKGALYPEEIGAGAYSFMSLFNHSCSPNVVRHCHGGVLVLRAIENIAAGQECLDNYGYHYALMDRNSRQYALNDQYFFDCTCKPCTEDWPLVEDLPIVGTNIGIDQSDLEKLHRGDLDCADEVLGGILPRMVELEQDLPNRNQAEMQEVVKQCFATRSNIRLSF